MLNPQSYRAEVLVEQLHVSVDDLQCQQLIVVTVDGAAEVQRGVPGEKAQYHTQ